MIVTIVGGGNAGSGNAFVAAENGHEVRILKTSRGVSHAAMTGSVTSGQAQDAPVFKRDSPLSL